MQLHAATTVAFASGSKTGPLPILIPVAFLAMALLFTLTIIRTRSGPVFMLASGHGRITIHDRQDLQLRL